MPSSPKRITILLAVRNDLTRSGLRALLTADPRFAVLGEPLTDVAGAAAKPRVDLVLIDEAPEGSLGDRQGAAVWGPAPKCGVVMIGDGRETTANPALAQVRGYLPQALAARGDWLLDTLALLSRPAGIVVWPAGLAEIMRTTCAPASPSVRPNPALALSERELTILRGLAAGLTEKQLAREASVSLRTVSRTIARLAEKLDVEFPFAMGVRAVELGLIGPR